MSTYSEQQGGPGAVLWAVIINITLTLDLLQTGTVITGSGQLGLNFFTNTSYSVNVTGQCFPSSISLVLSAKGMDNIFYNAVFTDRFTTQGEFYTNQSLILTKQ